MGSLGPSNSALKVLIVGAGLGGLAAAIALRQQGHDVELFEAAEGANEAGAAINVVPNAASVLLKLGVDVVESGAVLMETMRLIKSTGEVLNDRNILASAGRWESEWRLVHPAHLHDLLRRTAVSEKGTGKPARLNYGRKARSVDVETATVSFADGSAECGDVVVGADGVHSVMRAALDAKVKAVRGRDSAFRFLVTRKAAAEDPKTATFFARTGSMDIWYAEDRKIVVYPCDNNELFNFVCIHPAELSGASDGYNTKANQSLLLDIYKGFDRTIVAMLEKAEPDSLRVYPLFDMEPLQSFNKGRLALIGDAAHPFLPHLAQGGAMAFEDAMALGVMLSGECGEADVPSRLQLYNGARHERATLIQKYTRIVGGDGIEVDESTTEKLSLNEYLDYGFSHNEYHNSADVLRRHRWAQQRNLYFRQPIAFGPMPGPRQDFYGNSRPEMATQVTTRTATITFKTSATLLRQLFPTSAYSFVSRDTVANASFILQELDNLEWLGGSGYHLLGLHIHGVQYTTAAGEKIAASYLPVMFEDLADPIISGREELGFPKLYSEIITEDSGDLYKATMSWRGQVWATFEWPALESISVDAEQEAPEYDVLVHKHMPGTGKQAEVQEDSDYAVLCPTGIPQRGLVRRKRTCRAGASVKFDALDWRRLPTLHHIISRLAEVPVFEVVEASVVDAKGMSDFSRAARLQ